MVHRHMSHAPYGRIVRAQTQRVGLHLLDAAMLPSPPPKPGILLESLVASLEQCTPLRALLFCLQGRLCQNLMKGAKPAFISEATADPSPAFSCLLLLLLKRPLLTQTEALLLEDRSFFLSLNDINRYLKKLMILGL